MCLIEDMRDFEFDFQNRERMICDSRRDSQDGKTERSCGKEFGLELRGCIEIGIRGRGSLSEPLRLDLGYFSILFSLAFESKLYGLLRRSAYLLRIVTHVLCDLHRAEVWSTHRAEARLFGGLVR